MSQPMSQPDVSRLATRLVEWHGAHQRPLPWRNAPAGQRDAYRVWISEVMLQQTRVETVVDYYQRWLARFPSVTALAGANLQTVLKNWEGLGYYARARNLHRAAHIIVERFAGHLPTKRSDWLSLPGIGEYTVGAILSLAYNLPEPVLDGNVKRVLARLWDIDQSIDQPAVLRSLWQLARQMVTAASAASAGACNEALMELGATVCTPQNPRCLLCPVVDNCLAAANGTQADRPIMPARKRTPHFDVAAGVIWQGAPFGSRMLIAQRPHKGLLGGLWEFPGGKLEDQDVDLRDCLRREIEEELGIQIEVGAPITTIQHAYTHFRITLHVFHARHGEGEPQALACADWRWVTLAELEQYPFPVTDQKIIAVLRSEAAFFRGSDT